jgi:hypothetical protein
VSDGLDEKSLMELIDAAISTSSYTSGSLSTTWQIYLQRFPHQAGDGFAEGELCYEIGKHNESVFKERPTFKTPREALIDFLRRGLKDARAKAEREEAERDSHAESAVGWREHIAKLEALIGSRE